MNGLGAIACGIGLQDGLNPCIFMACAVFVSHGLWLNSNPLQKRWSRVIFVLVYVSSFLEFNFGYAQFFIFRKDFIYVARIIYLVLGVWAFILGVVFFKEWLLMYRGQPAKGLNDKKNQFFAGEGVGPALSTVVLAVVLSALATLWPVNKYIILLANEGFLKGQWHAVLPLLAGYVFMSMWPLWIVWAFLSIKNLRPSLLKIVYASIFFTASSCLIFIFK